MIHALLERIALALTGHDHCFEPTGIEGNRTVYACTHCGTRCNHEWLRRRSEFFVFYSCVRCGAREMGNDFTSKDTIVGDADPSIGVRAVVLERKDGSPRYGCMNRFGLRRL